MTEPLLSGDRLEQLTLARLTYPEVGASLREGALPGAYHLLQRQAVVGRGPEDLERATAGVLGWRVQRGAGVRVLPSSQVVLPAAVADLRVGPGAFSLRAPVRVVDVVDGPRRRGFAYGTLPGHPEVGEESFVLTIGDDGVVTFTVRAFSRPGGLLTRLGGPVARRAQNAMGGRYLRALQALV